jgi:menaquinone-dependent protoporphyrinogen oxidase
MKVLIAYATRCNSTAETAERIGTLLREQQHDAHTHSSWTVTVKPVSQVQVCDIQESDAVLLGSAIRMKQWLPEAVQCVRTHQHLLQQRPVAFFSVCLSITEETPDHPVPLHEYTEKVRAFITPIEEVFFPGKLDKSQLSWPTRRLMDVMRKSNCDCRDWHKVEVWTHQIGPKLVLPTSPVH